MRMKVIDHILVEHYLGNDQACDGCPKEQL